MRHLKLLARLLSVCGERSTVYFYLHGEEAQAPPKTLRALDDVDDLTSESSSIR